MLVCKYNDKFVPLSLKSQFYVCMTALKRLPYGISDFRQIRHEGKYFVDKTMFIEQMEQADNFLFLIRPRRFGKSLFLSMLRYYYDINEKECFPELFKDLWIANYPTPEQGEFQVLYLDFSRVMGDIDDLPANFNSYCSIALDDFADRYKQFYPEGFYEDVRAQKHFSSKFSQIDFYAKKTGTKLYLIVDEYDNFTNTVLNEQGEEVYHAVTHASGFYRGVFKLFKGMFHRILMMGVSPVTLDDLTSGYNIATNLTMVPKFNRMLGFSEMDVREMIRYYQSEGVLHADEDSLIEEMKPWYDGYCFSEEVVYTDPKMFNCDMVTYYLKNYIDNGCAPREMIDRNTRTDYAKLDKLIQLDRLDGNRKSVILEVAQQGFIYGSVADSFPAARLTDPDMFRSLLFYYGMLTISGMDGMDMILSIPNNNVRKQYYDYLLQEYQKIQPVDIFILNRCFKEAAMRGNWRPMMEYICQMYHDTTSVRSLIEGERNLQGFMSAYLNLNPYYLTAPEIELNHGYCDFFLMPDLKRCPTMKHSYILELKYLALADTEGKQKKQWEEAVQQVRGYGQGERVRILATGTELHLIVAQIRGCNLLRLEEIVAE